jgi:subtilase family serine protease
LDKLLIGTHTLECVIDPQNKIPETDENNNSGSKTFVVEKKQPLPDLFAQSVSTEKKKYSEGEEVQVVCFYKNIGGPFEGNWRLMVFVGGDSEYSNSVINTSGYVPWIWKAKGSGKYNVGCSLDTQQQVTESNEKNNLVTDTIEVVPLKGVILFEHDNYNGAQEIFMADDPDLRNNVIGNDKASSIKVPAGCVATLYEHINYQGKSETFGANDNWLGDNTIGNDNVSSIKVRCSK